MAQQQNPDIVGLLLMEAAATGNLDVLHKLLKDGAPVEGYDKVNKTPLMAAVEHGHDNVMTVLIQAGADIEAINKHDAERRALHVASRNGFVGALRCLLNAGADIHVRMKQGYTPLHEASYGGQVETVRVLLDYGANVDDCNVEGGWRPIHRAALWGFPEVIHVLINARADIEAQTTGGYRPIHCAAMRGHINVLKVLIERGCQPHANDKFGSNALHYAVGAGQLETVQWLVVKGGIPHDKLNSDNMTSEELAHFYGYHDVAWWLHKLNIKPTHQKHKNVARILEEYERIGDIGVYWCVNGDDRLINDQVPFRPWRIHYQDIHGWTLLHHAAFNNQRGAVETLLKLGAIPLCFNFKKETPADLAQHQGHIDLAQYLSDLTLTQPCLDVKEKVKLYDQLLSIISLAENQSEASYRMENNLPLSCVQKVSKLLKLGVPLYPIGGHDIYPLHLVINSNRNHILPLLLCAGAPLTSSADGLSVLEQAWLAKDVTTNVGVVITRAIIHSLQFEKDRILLCNREQTTHQRLLDGITYLVTSLNGDQPWKTSWPGETTKSNNINTETFESYNHPVRKENNKGGENKKINICDANTEQEVEIFQDVITDEDYWKELTDLLDEACELGATLTASFLKKSGASMSWCGSRGRTALHAALDAKQWDTVIALVRDMGANIFLQDSHGTFPLTLCPHHLKIQLIRVAVSHDYRSLDHLLSKAQNITEKHNMVYIMFLLAALYVSSNEGTQTNNRTNQQTIGPQLTTSSWQMSDHNWKPLFLYLISLLKEEKDEDFISTTWMQNLLIHLSKNKHYQSEEGTRDKDRNTDIDKIHNVMDSKTHTKDKHMKTSTNLETTCTEYGKVNDENECVVPVHGAMDDKKTGTIENENLKFTYSTSDGESTNIVEEYIFFKLVGMLTQVKLQGKEFSVINVEQDIIGTTLSKALLLSCKYGLTTLIHFLLTVGGVQIDCVVEKVSGSTALHVAAAQGRPGLCDFLLSRGASTTVLDRAGRTPAHLAYMFGHVTTGDRLVAAVKHVQDKANNVPRKLLECFEKYTEMYMLDKSANLNYYEQNDETSLIRSHLYHFKRSWQGNVEEAVRKLHVDFTKGEAREVKQVLTKELTRLLHEMEKVNPLFASDLQVLGSSADNLRLYAPDEFDCNILLKNITGFPGGGLSVNLQQLPHKEAVERCYNFSLNVIPTKDELKDIVKGSNFVIMFFEALSCCLEIFEPCDNRLGFVVPGVQKTQVGSNISFAWEGTEFPLLLIDVDVVPVVEVPWPQQMQTPALTPPNVNSIYISSTGDNNWRCSFATVENQIFRELSPERRLVLLACKLLVMTLKVESWAPKVIKEQHTYWIGHKFKIPAPAGFILKSSFLREMEEVRDDFLWEASHMMQRIKSVFQRMCKCSGNDNKSDKIYYHAKVKAYFGAECEKPTIGFSAPEILRFLDRW